MRVNIPDAFYSDSNETLFDRCIGCDTYLLAAGKPYVIEKAYRNYSEYEIRDTVFEYALCMNCLGDLHDQMSAESKQRIMAYFDKHVDMHQRMTLSNDDEEMDINRWLSSCMVKGSPVRELSEYQIFGLFEGESMIVGPFPYAIGGDAIDEIGVLLSNKTLGEIDGFMDDHFGLPPELRKLILDKPAFFI